MFTDIVGSTALTARIGDLSALELVRVHDALVRRGLAGYGGREIEHTGDGIMASFDVVANAVRAAADIQQRFVPTMPTRSKLSASGSASIRANRWRSTMTFLEPPCNSPLGYQRCRSQ